MQDFPVFLSTYVGNVNHIGVVYSSYNNSPEVMCSNYLRMGGVIIVKYDDLRDRSYRAIYTFKHVVCLKNDQTH